jgi:hypothetical protein
MDFNSRGNPPRSPGLQLKRFPKTSIRILRMRLQSQHRDEGGHRRSDPKTKLVQAGCQRRGYPWSSRVGDQRGGPGRRTQNQKLNQQLRHAHPTTAIAQNTSQRLRNRGKDDPPKRKRQRRTDTIHQNNRPREPRWHYLRPILR